MADCPYCERSFADESDIREHLYDDHEYDELGRIDAKRVDQYVDEHNLEGSNDDDPPDLQGIDEVVHTDSTADRHSDDRWELHDVQALSTVEIADKLAEHGIDTSEESFRNRAAEIDSAMTLADQWKDDHDVDASGYDRDFIWMAAEILWKRWAPDIPNRERIYDLVQEGRELHEEERRRLTKRIESGVSRAQREGKWLGRVPKGFRRDDNGYLQLIHEADRDAGEISYLEMRSAIERVADGESYRSVASDTPNIGRSTLMSIHKNNDRRAWYLDGETNDDRVDWVLANTSS